MKTILHGGQLERAARREGTRAERQWACDRQSSIRPLDNGLDAATKGSWTVVSVKDEWNQIFTAAP